MLYDKPCLIFKFLNLKSTYRTFFLKCFQQVVAVSSLFLRNSSNNFFEVRAHWKPYLLKLSLDPSVDMLTLTGIKLSYHQILLVHFFLSQVISVLHNPVYSAQACFHFTCVCHFLSRAFAGVKFRLVRYLIDCVCLDKGTLQETFSFVMIMLSSHLSHQQAIYHFPA